jgi:hypothetical protein
MADFNKFQNFVEELAKGLHHLHAAGDVVKVYLTNNAPSASADAVLGDLTGITEENGYAAADIQNDVLETDGVASITGVDVEWTATGAVGPFRYAVLYNDTHGSDALIGWWDYGSSISLANGEKFKVDFGTSIFTIT